MALGNPTKLGSNNGNAVASIAATLSAGCSIGDTILVAFFQDGADTVTASCADARSNTYQQDCYTAVTSAGTGLHCGVFSSRATTALLVSDTVTVTFSTSSVATCALLVYKVSGMAASSWKDQSVSPGGVAPTTTTPSSGNVTTTQASELLFGVCAHDSVATATAGSGYTLLDDFALGGGGRELVTEYEIVAATGTYAATFTLSGSSAARTTITTYKAAASAAGSANLMLLGVG